MEAIEKAFREKTLAFERLISLAPQVEIEPRHYFGEGVYMRAVTIPKGVLFTGMTHKQRHMTVILTGTVVLATPDGPVTINAPFVHRGGPGMKRLAYALTESRWLTMHKTKLQDDLASILKEQFEDGEDEVRMFDFETGQVKPKVLSGKEIKCLG